MYLYLDHLNQPLVRPVSYRSHRVGKTYSSESTQFMDYVTNAIVMAAGSLVHVKQKAHTYSPSNTWKNSHCPVAKLLGFGDFLSSWCVPNT